MEGVVTVATKSFLKKVNLQGRKECQVFIRAVEKSQQYSREHSGLVIGSMLVRAIDIEPEQIKKIFM